MSEVERTTRVNELLRREIGEYIERNIASELQCLVTVNKVKVSPDMHQAKVFISFLGGTEGLHKNSMRKILRHRGKIQAQINRNMTIRYTPVLDIRLDDSIAKGNNILKIMDDLGL